MNKQDDDLPPLSHLQFAILDIVGAGQVSGKELRNQLRKSKGIFKTGPGFYQLMSRLEDAGWVAGAYKQDVIDGVPIRERYYTVTGNGRQAYHETAKFYAGAAVAKAI